MKEQKKKRIVVILLLISCFISGYMFFMISETNFRQLKNLAQADSLIHEELSNFNISERQVAIKITQIDSGFTRKTYFVDVSPAFSKTQLHAELSRTFYTYGIKTPAMVSFPEKDVSIHFVSHGTVIRTLSLRTDAELVLNRKRAAILIAFDSIPDNELINELISLGEPIPIVLKIENPMQANEFKKQLAHRYSRILFWFQNDDGEDLMKTDPDAAIDKVQQLQSILPSAMVLKRSSSDNIQKLISNMSLTFIDAVDALVLHDRMDKTSFFKALSRLKTNQPNPLIIIEGSETTLNWLGEKLPELKKAGVQLISPPAMNL